MNELAKKTYLSPEKRNQVEFERLVNKCKKAGMALDDDVLEKALPLAKKIANNMKAELGCAGVNIVQNNGEAAGQTVHHLHIHIIPRYDGDMADPRGGVRGVIPEKQKY